MKSGWIINKVARSIYLLIQLITLEKIRAKKYYGKGDFRLSQVINKDN